MIHGNHAGGWGGGALFNASFIELSSMIVDDISIPETKVNIEFL